MFDFVTKHKRLMMIVLCILIIPPFAFFGIDFYFRNTGAEGSVATVSGAEISQQEFGVALRQAQDRMRDAVRNNPQLAARLESPEFKEAVLNDLIQRRVVLGWAAANGMLVSDGELRQVIAGIAAFRDENGNFSTARYERLLRAQGMTPTMFESTIRQDILLARIQSAYATTAFLPDAVVERLVRIREQQRELSQTVFEPRQYLAKAKVAEQNGAIGCIIYSDPEDDGYMQGDVFPKGPWRPVASGQRGSVQYLFDYPGDPLTPGKPAIAGTPRICVHRCTAVRSRSQSTSP